MALTYGGAENNFTVASENSAVTNIFANTKGFKDVTSYKLMRGVPDFGSLVQFNPYESGYAAFIICQMPAFIEMLAKSNSEYNKLVQNWMHLVEYEFKSFDGIDDISADVIDLGDDINKLEVINKVNMQSSSEFSLNYDEKSGSIFTKFAKLYLTGIKDPKTQVKTYHGLIHSGAMEPGFENEVFTFLFITTDNTMREVEAAYLIIAAQLKTADTSMYNYTKGDINKKEISLKFNGYPIQSPDIDLAASDMMKFLLSEEAKARQIIVNSAKFTYTGTESIGKTLKKYGATDGSTYKSISTAPTTYTAENFSSL